MFVGHYAAGLALKKMEPRASLGVLFLAVQFVDILFFPLVLIGVERMSFVSGVTESTNYVLEYMPYSHSLLASFFWAILAYALFRWVILKKHAVAVVVALAVLSHWFLDLIVHTPDLPLWNDASLKLGFGLWNSAITVFVLETIILLVALLLYLRSSTAKTKLGGYAMGVLVVLLVMANMLNIFGPPVTENNPGFAISALAAYFLFAGVAFWLDSMRS